MRQIIETKVFRLSKTKTKYFACNFNDVTLEAEVEVRNDSQIIPKTKRGNFKYLGSIIIGYKMIDDVSHHIGVGWVN